MEQSADSQCRAMVHAAVYRAQFTSVPTQILMNYALSAPIHNILCFPCFCKRSHLASWQCSCLLTSNTWIGPRIHRHPSTHTFAHPRACVKFTSAQTKTPAPTRGLRFVTKEATDHVIKCPEGGGLQHWRASGQHGGRQPRATRKLEIESAYTAIWDVPRVGLAAGAAPRSACAAARRCRPPGPSRAAGLHARRPARLVVLSQVLWGTSRTFAAGGAAVCQEHR